MFLEWYQLLLLILATPGLILFVYVSIMISGFIFEALTSGMADGLSVLAAIVYFLLILIALGVLGFSLFLWGFWGFIYSIVLLELTVIIFLLKK